MELVDDRCMLFDIPTSIELTDEEQKADPDAGKNKTFHFSYDMQTGKLSQIDSREKAYPDWVNLSPDGSTAVYEKGYNLWYMSREDVEKLRKDPGTRPSSNIV